MGGFIAEPWRAQSTSLWINPLPSKLSSYTLSFDNANTLGLLNSLCIVFACSSTSA